MHTNTTWTALAALCAPHLVSLDGALVLVVSVELRGERARIIATTLDGRPVDRVEAAAGAVAAYDLDAVTTIAAALDEVARARLDDEAIATPAPTGERPWRLRMAPADDHIG